MWRWRLNRIRFGGGSKHRKRCSRRRDELRDDAVTTPLATCLGVTGKLANLVTGGVFSLILEGLGCFCWYLMFLRCIGHTVAQAC